MVNWIDAHTHLDEEPLYSQKLDVLRRAEEAGVKKMLLVNSEASRENFQRTLECLTVPSSIQRFAALGVHPHHAKSYNPSLEQTLLDFLKQPGVLAFGEMGLDFYYNNSPRETQVAVFQHQMRLALERRLPVVIHCRDAYGELAELLRAETRSWRGMIHCFAGTPQEAEVLLELGFFISFSGIVTFRTADVLREAAQLVPLDRILIETDAPYLAPVPHRGKTNEPAFVADTGIFLAALRNISQKELADQMQKNFATLFGA